MSFDTIIRGGTVVTASDIFACDVGISGGRITALADDLGDAPEIIDATGLLVMPDGSLLVLNGTAIDRISR